MIILSLVVSVILTALKFIAWFNTYSVAILSDALESIINVVAAGFASYSIYLTGLPKDKNHPYGHGKIEFFSIGVEGAMIFVAGCLILFKAIEYFISPRNLAKIDMGVILIAVTAVVNFALGKFLVRSGRRLPSITIGGNGQHIITDAYSSAALVVALFVIKYSGWHWIDPLASCLIGIFILRKGYRLIRRSVSGLMDETDLKVVDELIMILSASRKDAWIDVHNLRVQRYGNNYHCDCHLTLPYYYTLDQVHAEMKALAAAANREVSIGEVEFFIHTDPCVPSCCHYCLLQQCPVRKHPFTGKITWTKENVLPNRKHGEVAAGG